MDCYECCIRRHVKSCNQCKVLSHYLMGKTEKNNKNFSSLVYHHIGIKISELPNTKHKD
jgi:hypothetical protein